MDCTVRDVNVHYEEFGTGRPLLILHGWASDGRTEMPAWEPLFQTRSGWRRIYPDVAAIVRAPVPPWLRGPDDLLGVLLEVLDTLAPGARISVTGVSWGGYIAAGIVHERPDRIDGVLFSVPSLEYGASKRDVPQRQVIARDPAFSSWLQPDEEWLADFFVVQEQGVLEATRAWPFAEPYEAVQETVLRNKPFSFDPTALPEPCLAPALFLLGRQDQITGYRKAWSMIEALPRATFAVLDRAGHLVEAEQPAIRLALVEDWLNRVEEYSGANAVTLAG